MSKFFAVSFAVVLFSISAQANICAGLFKTKELKIKIAKSNTVLEWPAENGIFPNLANLKASDLLVAQKESIKEIQSVIAQVKKIKNPTFENTIAPLEYGEKKMRRFDNIWGVFDSNFKTVEYKSIEQTLLDTANKFSNEMWMDKVLFEKVEAVYKNSGALAPDQVRLVESYRKGFVSNGLNLTGKSKERFIEIKNELSKVQAQFSSNSIKSRSEFNLHIKDVKELEGLSDVLIGALKAEAIAQKKDGFIVTLEDGIYLEIMKYAENRDLRKTLYIARGNLAYKNKNFDNTQNVFKIAALRQEMAVILGFKNYSEYVLKDNMAHDAATVRELMDQLVEVYKPHAIKEEQELRDYVKSKTGTDELEAWDRSFWVEKLLVEKYSFDESIIKEYFEYSKVQKAAFDIARKLFGLKFVERTDLPKYDKDTQVFEVRNKNNDLMAYFVVDPFSRKGVKSGGAWASKLTPTFKENGVRAIPIVTNSTNFTKAAEGKPQLLTVLEGTTLFHEFGHALHTILSEARYPSQSGTAVARDFVELPSQMFENFFYEKEVLGMFAYHYKNKTLIPEQYIESLKNLSKFRSATAVLRQIGLVSIDLAWHGGEIQNNGRSIFEIEQEILRPIQIAPTTVETVTSTSFGHIFEGGYSSQYYSYKWAEILDADAFSIFKKNGLFNQDVANRFLVILQGGGSKDAQELYRDFAGRDPSPEAMYERDGITPP